MDLGGLVAGELGGSIAIASASARPAAAHLKVG
jgi:hypothetical protein